MATTSQTKIPLATSLLSAGATAEVCDDYALLDVNQLLTGNRDGCLALIVTGDSMRGDILPGYIVIIDPNQEPQNGDTVVVSINGETCIKIFQQHERKLFLVPKNDEYPVREVQPTDYLHILGKVTGHVAVY